MKWLHSRTAVVAVVAAVAVFTIALGSWQGWLAQAQGDVIWVNAPPDPATEPQDCADTTLTTIAAALAEVDEPEDTIRLCTGSYDGNVNVDTEVTIEGDPGASRDDVIVTGSSNGFTVQSDDVTIQHLTLDGDNKTDRGVDNTGGYDNLRVKDVVIKDFDVGVFIVDAKNNVVEEGSNIHSNVDGVVMFDSATPAGGNAVRGSTVADNDMMGISVDGEYDAKIEDNSLSGNDVAQIYIGNTNYPTQVHIWRNTITIASDGIDIIDAPADALIVIGGSEDNRNEFVGDASTCAGGGAGNCFVRLDCGTCDDTVDATYNKWGDASGPGEVTQGIWGNDNECGGPPAWTAVVYRPWTTASVPTPTPSPTPSPSPSPSPSPTAGTRTFNLEMGWNNFVWTGPTGTDPATALSCIDGFYVIAYRYVALTQTWQRYVPGDEDLSNMTSLNKYDSLLVLVTASGVVCENMPVDLNP